MCNCICWTAAFAVTTAFAHAMEHTLHYSQAASAWNETLPIGNGRLGATPDAKPDQKTIVLNEYSLFSGGFRNRVHPKSLETISLVRKLMNQGNLTGAGGTCLGRMVGVPSSQRKYEPAGFLSISTGHDQDQVSDYSRSLDLNTGLAKSVYKFGGEVVTNAVDHVIAFYFTAD